MGSLPAVYIYPTRLAVLDHLPLAGRLAGKALLFFFLYAGWGGTPRRSRLFIHRFVRLFVVPLLLYTVNIVWYSVSCLTLHTAALPSPRPLVSLPGAEADVPAALRTSTLETPEVADVRGQVINPRGICCAPPLAAKLTLPGGFYRTTQLVALFLFIFFLLPPFPAEQL